MLGIFLRRHSVYEDEASLTEAGRTSLNSESTSDGSDAGLVAALKDGDRDALAELYRRHADTLYTAAYRITGDEGHAQDAVHDVFVGLERALRSYEERGDLPGWLRKVTVRTALMGIRSRTRRSRREEAVEGTSRTDPEPVEERLAVREALDRMPEKLRLVFVLKEIEGYGHGEIADQLGISEGTSSVRLSRAWAFLRRTLGGAS